MTRKDFELIARVINRSHQLSCGAREALAQDFAEALKATNARFDYQRFVNACGTFRDDREDTRKPKGCKLDERGMCPECGRDYVVTADGPLETHCTSDDCPALGGN